MIHPIAPIDQLQQRMVECINALRDLTLQDALTVMVSLTSQLIVQQSHGSPGSIRKNVEVFAENVVQSANAQIIREDQERRDG